MHVACPAECMVHGQGVALVLSGLAAEECLCFWHQNVYRLFDLLPWSPGGQRPEELSYAITDPFYHPVLSTSTVRGS